MKTFETLLTIAGAILLCGTASAQNRTLNQKARHDAIKVRDAAQLDEEQFLQICEYQRMRYRSIDSVKRLNLPEQEFAKARQRINGRYQRQAEAIMNREQRAAFHAWKQNKQNKQNKWKAQ